MREQLLRVGVLLALGALLAAGPALASDSGRDYERPPLVTVQGGDLSAAGERFIAFGFNYLGPRDGGWVMRYLDLPTDRRLRVVRQHLNELRAMGANTIRIPVELTHVMRSPTDVSERTLRALERLFGIAERKGIYLDVTGNVMWRPEDHVAWYDELPEDRRWQVQARFWQAVAAVGRPYRSILVYELTSEPIVPDRPVDSWYTGWLNGYTYGQYVVRDPAGRDREAIAAAWTQKLAGAIRSRDRRHAVSIGVAGLVAEAGGPLSTDVADYLDLLIFHQYPTKGEEARSVRLARTFAAEGKPVLLGETFPMRCGPDSWQRFLLGARPYLDGYLSFFYGNTPGERKPKTLPEALKEAATERFLALRDVLLTPQP